MANDSLKAQLLAPIREMDNFAFEFLVNQLLSKMGFGRVETTKKSGDGGIDGFIYGDRLGLSVIGVQSKRFTENKVGRPDIQGFIGALKGLDGVFVTSSDFSTDAEKEANEKGAGSKIALINGNQLVNYMIEYNLGVQETGTIYNLKRIDKDFFDEL